MNEKLIERHTLGFGGNPLARSDLRFPSPSSHRLATAHVPDSIFEFGQPSGMHYLASHQDENRTFERTKKGECYVAVIDGRLVGTVTLSKATNTGGTRWYDRPDVASFGQFAVDPELQGIGLGSKFMDLVEARAKDKGVAELALDTSEHATDLIARYQRRGYRFRLHAGRWLESERPRTKRIVKNPGIERPLQ